MTSVELQGVFRSLRVYHGDPAHAARMDALYARFVKPGDLAFDIGAHVGDRTSSFRRLGARVVALEPQPLLARALRLIHGRDGGVDLVRGAVGAASGSLRLFVNSANPTVTTASRAFIAQAGGAPGWEGQEWDRAIDVPVTTLDTLIAVYGHPAFVKIDVEGYEDCALDGLSLQVPALSFEFTTIAKSVALRCLDLLARLGPYRYDLALGETHELDFGRFVGRAEMAGHIAALPHEANSGDIYAVLGA